MVQLPYHTTPAAVRVYLCLWKALETFSVGHPDPRVKVLHQGGEGCSQGSIGLEALEVTGRRPVGGRGLVIRLPE